MPRDGTGASDNVVEAGENLIHGAGGEGDAAGSGVDRSSKAAPAPEPEKGEAFEELGGSGAGDSVAGNTGSGKGSEDVSVDKKVSGEAKS